MMIAVNNFSTRAHCLDMIMALHDANVGGLAHQNLHRGALLGFVGSKSNLTNDFKCSSSI